MHQDIIHLDQGEPVFLQEIFQDLLGVMEPIVDFHYPEPGGDPELLEQLYRLHPQFSHIVVTNGASQALCGALEYFAKYGNKQVYYPTPYWSRIPTICQRAGLVFSTSPGTCFLVTSPNNPDGKVADLNCKPDIHDAAYFNPFYPIYGECSLLESSCTIFSGSKMIGVSGYRIGWLATNNKEIADYVEDYVDNTTVGVSVLSQKEVANILRHLRSGKFHKGFVKAKEILIKNHLLLEKSLGPFIDEINSSGLFGWFKVKDPEKFDDALFKGLISLMPGTAYGVDDKAWYRMNLGVDEFTLRTALSRLSGILSK